MTLRDDDLGSLTRSFQVSVDLNTTPTAMDGTVNTPEDTIYTFAAGDFNFSDPDAGDTLQEVSITTLPAFGSLYLDLDSDNTNDGGTENIAAGGIVMAADLAAGRLKLEPQANANGSPYDSFTFRVGDGESLSVAAYLMTINVTPVNDAPSFVVGADQTVAEDAGPQSVGLQVAGSRVYWINNTRHTIQSSNLDGSDLTDAVALSSYGSGMDLEVDLAGGKIYWSDSANNFSVQRADLDGSNIQTLVSNIPASGGTQLALDTLNGKLYYLSADGVGSNRFLNRMNLDGTDQEPLFELLSDASKAGS